MFFFAMPYVFGQKMLGYWFFALAPWGETSPIICTEKTLRWRAIVIVNQYAYLLKNITAHWIIECCNMYTTSTECLQKPLTTHDMMPRLRSRACSWRSCATWGSGTRAPSSCGTTTGRRAPPQQGGQAAQVPLNTHTNISFMFTRAVCYVNMSSYNLQSSQSSLNQIYCIDICAFSKSSLSLDTVSTKLIRVSWS